MFSTDITDTDILHCSETYIIYIILFKRYISKCCNEKLLEENTVYCSWCSGELEVLLKTFLALFCTFQAFCTSSRPVLCCHRTHTCQEEQSLCLAGCPWGAWPCVAASLVEGPGTGASRAHSLSPTETLIFGELFRKSARCMVGNFSTWWGPRRISCVRFW